MSAYAIGHLKHVDMGPDIIRYLQKIDAALAPFSGRFLIHGDPIEVLEGTLQGNFIVIEFPDIQHARQWYASPAYRAILPLRTENARGTVFLVPGVLDDHKATDVLHRPAVPNERDSNREIVI
jgi:uncharacterized protein (DUF1330 family)